MLWTETFGSVEPSSLLILWLIFITTIIPHVREQLRRRPGPRQTSSTPKVQHTIRFRSLPAQVTQSLLRAALMDTSVDNQDTQSYVAGSFVVRMSLAPSLGGQTESTTATVCLKRLPQILKQQFNVGRSAATTTTISLKFGNETHQILVDNHFYGLTPLYCHQDSVVDIVAVTGWNGKAFNSFKPESSEEMWLRDWLGQDLAEQQCYVRVLTYGYSSKVAESDSDASLHDYGQELLQALRLLRAKSYKRGRASRPLVFVGHSLGGLLIKQALKDASQSDDPEDRDIFESCSCMVMFGVPNLGLDNRAILSMTQGQKNNMLALNLGLESQYLPELEKEFARATRAHYIQIVSIYELLDSPSVVRVSPYWWQKKEARWSRSGPKIRMVTRESAWTCGNSLERLSSNTNHSNLVKFSSRNEQMYQDILERLHRNIKQNTEKVEYNAANAELTVGERCTKIVQPNDIPPAKANERNIMCIGIPDHLEDHFIGREEILNEIDVNFIRDSGHNAFVLHGNGGMGKTQVALKYAKSRINSYRQIVWIDASSAKSIRESLRNVAEALSLNSYGDENVTSTVLSSLAKSDGNTLLVYDNLDDGRDVKIIGEQHISHWKHKFRILITSRNREYLQFAWQDSCIETFEEGEALQLIHNLMFGSKAIDTKITSSLARVCQLLGNLPLALKQAASYMKVLGLSPQDYARQLEAEPTSTLSYQPEWWPYKKTVLTVWDSSLKRISDTSSYAAEWFAMCNFLGQSVPHKLFVLAHLSMQRRGRGEGRSSHSLAQQRISWIFATDSSRPWSDAWMRGNISALNSMSLIKTESRFDNTTVSAVHPLVQRWSQLRLGVTQQRHFLSTAASLIHVCAEELRSQQNLARDSAAAYLIQQWLLPHANACLEFASQMLRQNIGEFLPMDCTTTFALFQLHERKYEEAQIMLETSIARNEDDVIGAISSRRILSLVLRRQKKYIEAENVQKAAIDLLGKACLEPDWKRRQSLRAQAELAVIYRDMKNLDKAYELQSMVVNEMKEFVGEEGQDTIHEISCLARILSKQGKLMEVLSMETSIFDIYRRRYNDRPEIIDLMRNLALTLYKLEQYDSAIILEEEVLQRSEDLYHPDHVEVASASQSLATSYRACDRLEEALLLYNRALRIRRNVLGESHEATQNSAEHASEVRSRLGMINKAQTCNPTAAGANKSRVDSGIGMD